MVIVGVLYLVFEENILARSGFPIDSTQPAQNVLSRSLIGAQVTNPPKLDDQTDFNQIGLILLAMIVTRSSVMSIQAKVGLPRGNQILGWCALGILSFINSSIRNLPK